MNTTAIVVNHDAGETLDACVGSLLREKVEEIVLVDNASSDGSAQRVAARHGQVRLVSTGSNIGYGAGANRGIGTVETDFVLVSNPDVVLHEGSLEILERVLVDDPNVAIAGPRIEQPDGSRYPSARRFPSFVDAAGHALFGKVVPSNPFTRRYRMEDASPVTMREVDWVSGACFLARTKSLRELGGFDEAYFMYMEDVDLCWRAQRAGWQVLYVDESVVTHSQAVSTSRRPYRMLLAHHRSAFRFASRTTRGWRRVLLPVVGVLLACRFLVGVAAGLAGQLRRRR